MFRFRTAPATTVLAVALTAFAAARLDSERSVSRPAARGFLHDVATMSEEEQQEEGHAWEMFEWWYGQRAYPQTLIPKDGFWRAWQQRASLPADPDLALRAVGWETVGPDNVGGRMLAVALDPTAPDRLWAGAASGGLWLSMSAGEGAAAWTRVETGFPSLSVSAIVIDADPTKMWIGTGEISRYERPLVGTPGARSSYGLGVLKSTDGGLTWSTTGLTWTFDQSRAVLAMRQDPLDGDILWAATSEGLYKSTDAGDTWTLSLDRLMTMDVVVHPTTPSTVYATVGQLGVPDDTQTGVWKTTDGGASWTRLGGGLPTTNFGRTPLTISADGDRVWAGVSNASTRQITGLYRTTNGGSTWSTVSTTNWASSQAWYDNTIAVSPADANLVLCGGLDAYRSTTGGSGLSRVSRWFVGYDGVVPPGGPEGPSDYVHADHHAILFDPSDPSIVYIATDGGVFKSTDAGMTWAGKNGGLVTSQFYAGFASTSVTRALGGLQDNGTLLYEGMDSWNKVFGGDGGWCAIDPSSPNVLYEEYVYLNMYKSVDGGASWDEVHPQQSGSTANFIAPFVLAPSSPLTLYAGSLGVEKTTDGGSSWFFPDGNTNWNGTPLATIGVSFGDADRVVAGTGSSSTTATMEVRRTTNGGVTWQTVTGLPDRYPTDFAYDPSNDDVVWGTFSGYGTGHVFRSTDAGLTWADVTGDLPDIPHQTVAVDPLDPAWAYVGTDLGTYRTTDGGTSWAIFDTGMPTAMILDLVIDPVDRGMWAATFGNGVWRALLPGASTGVEVATGSGFAGLALGSARPNPFRGSTSVVLTLARPGEVRLAVHDAAGRRVRTLLAGERPAGTVEAAWDGRDDAGRRVAAGTYFLRAESGGGRASAKITLLP